MRYLCKKQLAVGGRTYHPGEIVPDDVILPERGVKLVKSGHIVEMNQGTPKEEGFAGKEKLFTLEEVEKMISEAIDEAVNNTVMEMEQKQKELQEVTGVLQEEGFLAEGTVIIPVKGGSDGENEQQTAVPTTPDEIQQVFSIMQMNATEGAEAIAGVKSENVLILLHAADARKTIKDAAKKQADNIFATQSGISESVGFNAIIGTNTKGADV